MSHGYAGGLGRRRLFARTAPPRLPVIESVNLCVNQGDFVAIVGPSGCGKTTLIRILAGLVRPDSGEVLDCGAPVTGAHHNRSLVFQNPHLFPWLTVEQNIGFGPRHRGIDRSDYQPLVDELLSLVGLESFRSALPQQLSGGMKQRVALARALANRPHILLLDEPLGALDALTRERMQEELRTLWRRTGCTVVLITHSVEEALYLANRLLVLSARPARIQTEIAATFSTNGHASSGREVKSSHEFLMVREQVLEHIWNE